MPLGVTEIVSLVQTGTTFLNSASGFAREVSGLIPKEDGNEAAKKALEQVTERLNSLEAGLSNKIDDAKAQILTALGNLKRTVKAEFAREDADRATEAIEMFDIELGSDSPRWQKAADELFSAGTDVASSEGTTELFVIAHFLGLQAQSRAVAQSGDSGRLRGLAEKIEGQIEKKMELVRSKTWNERRFVIGFDSKPDPEPPNYKGTGAWGINWTQANYDPTDKENYRRDYFFDPDPTRGDKIQKYWDENWKVAVEAQILAVFQGYVRTIQVFALQQNVVEELLEEMKP